MRIKNYTDRDDACSQFLQVKQLECFDRLKLQS
jgi:hypothetical protein